MRKIVLFVSMVSTLLLCPIIFADDKAAEPPKEEQPKAQAGPSQPSTGRRFGDLSPEEQAKLKARWQNMSTEERTKLREKTRERAASENQGPQAQARRDFMSMELARLQEEYRANIGELEAVKQIAIKENAKETIAALAKLIARREQQFNQQIQALQRRVKTLQTMQEGKAGPQGQTQPDKLPKPDPKPLPKTEPPKSQSPATKR